MTLPTATTWLLVALGGAAGAMARFGIGLWLHPDRLPQAIPYSTLLVNVLGSLVLGWLFAQMMSPGGDAKQSLWWLAGVGFCGAFTTMSTLSVETLTLLQRQHFGLALMNWGIQSVACLGAAWLGFVAGRSG